MQIKLKNQNEDGKFQEVYFEGFPDGKKLFKYRKHIEPHVVFLQRSGLIVENPAVLINISYDRKLSERWPEQQYTAIDQEYEKEYVKVPKSKIKYVNVYKEPHGDEIGAMFEHPNNAKAAAGLSDTYFKTLKIIDE